MASLSHLIWGCPTFDYTRVPLLAIISSHPPLKKILLPLDLDSRMYYVLGRGQATSSSREWKDIILAITSHVSTIVSHLKLLGPPGNSDYVINYRNAQTR